MQCDKPVTNLGSISCGDVISGNISNDEINSYRFDSSMYSQTIYIRSDCNTHPGIRMNVIYIESTFFLSRISCKKDNWIQCDHDTEGIDYVKIFTDYPHTNYTLNVFDPFNDGTPSSYNIYVACNGVPIEPMVADCYIGCNETVTGYYNYGRPQFCEITDYTEFPGTNVFSTCIGNYHSGQDNSEYYHYYGWDLDPFRSHSYRDRDYLSTFSRDNNECSGTYFYSEWYNFFNFNDNDTETQYLRISNSESGDYSVSMHCGPSATIKEEMQCPSGRMNGTLNGGESVWYKIYFNSTSFATFDGCLSENVINITVYDSQFRKITIYESRNRCPTLGHKYFEVYKNMNYGPYFVQIKNGDYYASATYSVDFLCGLTRRTSINYGTIHCGDFINGTLNVGDTHLYAINYTQSTQQWMYIVADCNTNKGITWDLFKINYCEYNCPPLGENLDFNWQCDGYTQRSWIVNYKGYISEIEVFHDGDTSQDAVYYGINIYCGSLPQEPYKYGGDISCGSQNILGTNSMYYNFSNPLNQTVTFSACSMTFSSQLGLQDENFNWLSEPQSQNFCPYETFPMLVAGEYIFTVYRQHGSGSFLLDVICDAEYIAPNPKTSDDAGNLCNYIVINNIIWPLNECINYFEPVHRVNNENPGSYFYDVFSQKYICMLLFHCF